MWCIETHTGHIMYLWVGWNPQSDQGTEHSPQPPRPLAGQYPFPLSRGQCPMLEVYSNDIKHSLFFCRSPIYPHCICEAHPCRVWQKFFTHVFVSRGGTGVLVILNRACDWFLVWWPGLREPVSALCVNPLLKVGTCSLNLASLLWVLGWEAGPAFCNGSDKWPHSRCLSSGEPGRALQSLFDRTERRLRGSL